jgi:carboxyl-terminal processing protease
LSKKRFEILQKIPLKSLKKMGLALVFLAGAWPSTLGLHSLNLLTPALKARSRTGVLEVEKQDVALLPPARGVETELVRQVLRIVDQHYVQRERLDPIDLLQSGLRVFTRDGKSEVEFVRSASMLSISLRDENKVRLCPNSKGSQLQFCRDLEKSSLRNAADPALARLAKKKLDGNLDSVSLNSEPLVRLGDRVFFSSQSPSLGLRYLENFVRPLLLEISRTREIPLEKVLHSFLNSMLDELDPHSAFLSPDEYRDLRSGTRGQFGGVGLVIDEVHELPFVREIVPNSPAHMAGVKPGDVLVRVGAQVVSFLPLEQVLQHIREVTVEKPTPVWLYRPSSGRLFRVFLTREEIPTRSVETKVVIGRPDVVHIRVTGFSSHTVDDIVRAFDDARRNSDGRIKYFLLDLRGNPGGLLDQAVQVADLFIRQGRIVTTKSRYDDQVESASRGQKMELPLAVLVNSSSASASEIVAGALKDHHRAWIVGERTFGKGSVQSLFELGNSTALKLTIAHYFTPSGQSLQSVGVEPHVVVKMIQTRKDAVWMSGASEPEREESLSSHLDNPGDFNHQTQTQVASQGPKGSVWAQTKEPSSAMDFLQDLNFSYPSFENMEAVTDLQTDAVARVAVQLLEMKKDSRAVETAAGEAAFWNALREIQKRESSLFQKSLMEFSVAPEKQDLIEFFSPSSFFAESLENWRDSVEIIQPVKARIGGLEKLFVRSGFRDFGPNTCCSYEAYQFRIKTDRPEALGPVSLLGMRLRESLDGSVVWRPIRLQKESDKTFVGSFPISPVFRAFLSETLEGRENFGVAFLLQARLGEEPIMLGALPADGRPQMREKGNTLSVAVAKEQDTHWKSTGQAGEDLAVQIRLPASGSWAEGPLELTLVPLVDDRVENVQKKVMVRKQENGEWIAQFHMRLRQQGNFNQAQNFNGVIGGILRSPTGEVLGKWPVAFVEREGVRPNFGMTQAHSP